MSASKTLIFIPTYNERGNAETLYRQLRGLGLDADILFVDDHSPDGTGEILDKLATDDPRLFVVHREGKQGIGTAHQAGIAWAYDHAYHRLITMDCDFTHSPSDIPMLLAHADDCDVVVGSRYMHENSLPGWNIFRRSLTHLGHFLTRRLLGIPQDATGAFRVYNLEKIPRRYFAAVTSKGYSFFFESMFLFTRNGVSIHEVPITLPARTYGHSKMSGVEAVRSGLRVLKLWLLIQLDPGRFVIGEPFSGQNPLLQDPQGWDSYWQKKTRAGNFVYDIIAWCYRNFVIKPNMTRWINNNFAPDANLLHTGCGSGEIDRAIQERMRITALDISPPALSLYKKNNPRAQRIVHGSILDLPFDEGSFDGVYSAGVVEHFSHDQIVEIFVQSARVLKPGGRIVCFWPHRRGTSVAVLRFVHWFFERVLRKPIQLHPPEPSLFQSREMAAGLAQRAGLKLVTTSFGPRDFWVQAVVVLEKPGNS